MTGKLTMRKCRTYWWIFRKSRLNYGTKVCFVGIFFVYSPLTYFHIPDMSPTKGDVALIRASNGTVLRKVADDPKWQKIFQEGDHRCQEAAAARPKKHGP